MISFFYFVVFVSCFKNWFSSYLLLYSIWDLFINMISSKVPFLLLFLIKITVLQCLLQNPFKKYLLHVFFHSSRTCYLVDALLIYGKFQILECYSVQFSLSVVSRLCDPMNRSTPGFPVHHQLPEFTQTHVHRVSDAIQPSHYHTINRMAKFLMRGSFVL